MGSWQRNYVIHVSYAKGERSRSHTNPTYAILFLWLLCNVRFVQNTQRTRLQAIPFVRCINYLLKVGVCAIINQVVAHYR